MKQFRAGALLSAVALISGLTLTTPVAATAAPPPSAASQQASNDDANQARFDRIVSRLPANWEQRRDAARQRFDIDHSPAEAILRGKLDHAETAPPGVIDPTDYECAPTALDAYVDEILAPVDPFALLLLSLLGGLDIPTYDALLFGTPKDDAYDLLPAYEDDLTTSFNYSQRFWDVKLNDVQLLAMHGEMITDLNRVARTVEFLYGVGPADATAIAQDIVGIVESDPALEGGANPIFTLNAFAFSAEGETDPVIRKIKDKTIFGDGILAALKAIGLRGVGPEAVMGHEMAHHVQYEADLFDSDLPAPEATRRTELMADGFGTYFATHKKGMGFKPAQILKVGQTFYDVGDCAFDNPGHHGTPNQRRAASAWGAAEVAYADNPVKVMPSLRLAKRFDKVLPQLVAPDAPQTVTAYRLAVAS